MVIVGSGLAAGVTLDAGRARRFAAAASVAVFPGDGLGLDCASAPDGRGADAIVTRKAGTATRGPRDPALMMRRAGCWLRGTRRAPPGPWRPRREASGERPRGTPLRRPRAVPSAPGGSPARAAGWAPGDWPGCRPARARSPRPPCPGRTWRPRAAHAPPPIGD